ncbi:MAG: SsrA-binding protein SmpB [Phycisphaeraceae bacterium]
MAKRKQQLQNLSPTILNRRAHRDYQIVETLECGIALTGTEVKSIRQGRVSLAEGFARTDPRTRELYLYNVDISPYPQAAPEFQHEPKRPRKLLARRREIERLFGHTTSKGVTLIPTKMYFVRGKVKVEIAVATGKRHHDKRQDIKKKEADREMRRAMSKREI